ncbi:MAG: tandem-95 repeat protein [Euryarchaeota archaeon]|nr:tandem-95 repeat protein [Euryarchaeota archaeon]
MKVNIRKISEAVSPVISVIVSLFIVLSAVGSILYWGIPYMEDQRNKAAQENVGYQFDSAVDALDDLNKQGDTTSLHISADSGYIEEEVASAHLVEKPITSGETTPEDKGDRTIAMYSIKDGYNFTAYGLNDSDNEFTLDMYGDRLVTRAEAYWLDEGVWKPLLQFYPTSYPLYGVIGKSYSTRFEIWNDGIGTLNYELHEDPAWPLCDWLDFTPKNGSSMGEHDTITVNINTTGLIPNQMYVYDINISSNGIAANGVSRYGGNGTFTVYIFATTNNPPVANDDYVITLEDTSVLIDVLADVLANDTDPDGDTIYLSSFDAKSLLNGTITLDNGETPSDPSDDLLNYTPPKDIFSPPMDSFRYNITDGVGGYANATVNITITPVNDPPVANDDYAKTNSGTQVVIDVLANDTDVDSKIDNATVTIGIGPQHGVIIGPPNPVTGKVTYEPTSGFNGMDKFTYTVKDVEGSTSNIAKVEIAVGNVPPVAVDDAAITDQNSPVEIPVLLNDYDPDGKINPKTVAIKEQPLHGDITTIDSKTGNVTYEPDEGYKGEDIFTYTVNDNQGATSNEAIVKIIIKAPEPKLCFDPKSHQFIHTEDTAPFIDSTTFNIWNCGSGTLTYNLLIINQPSWLTGVTPMSGSCEGSSGGGGPVGKGGGGSETPDEDQIQITINTAGLVVGEYSCDIIINSNDVGGGVGRQPKFTVYLTVLPGGPNPFIVNIDDQCVQKGDSFETINLNDCVFNCPCDPDNLIWTAESTDLSVGFSYFAGFPPSATVTSPSDWTGYETIAFTATCPGPGGETATGYATFGVYTFEVVTGEAYDWFNTYLGVAGRHVIEMYGYLKIDPLIDIPGCYSPPTTVEVWFEWYTRRAGGEHRIVTSGTSQHTLIDVAGGEELSYYIDADAEMLLDRGSNYWYRAYAQIVGTSTVVQGTLKKFATSAVDVVDSEAMRLNDTIEILEVRLWNPLDILGPGKGVDPDDGEYYEAYFNVWGTGVETFWPYPPLRVWKDILQFSGDFRGLKPGREYSATAFVSTGFGDLMDDNSESQFTMTGTPVDALPVVSNVMAYDIRKDITGADQVNLMGNLGYANTPPGEVEAYFEIIDMNSPNNWWDQIAINFDPETEHYFVTQLYSGYLYPGHTYKWRAVAYNSVLGYSYAKHWCTFKTLDYTTGYQPKIITDMAEIHDGIGDWNDWIYLHGNVLDDGDDHPLVGPCDVYVLLYDHSMNSKFIEDSLIGSTNDWADSSFQYSLKKVKWDRGWDVLDNEKYYYRFMGVSQSEDVCWSPLKDFIFSSNYQAPTASFTYTTEGANVTFDASASHDNDESSQSIIEYYWEFGDERESTAFGQYVEHYYSSPGTYTVSLRVFDDDARGTDEFKIYQKDITISNTCFLAGTEVLMADGSYKNIERVKVGDLVRSYEEQTKEFVSCKVTKVFHHSPEEMTDYYLIINDALKVTPNHLLYANGKWIPAGTLNIGDCLFNKAQKTDYRVYSIKKVYERAPTFDLEVEPCHTYFVSIDDGVDILVHNDNDRYDGMPAGTIHWEQLTPTGQGSFKSTEEWPFTGSVCIYLYDNTIDSDHPEKCLIGKIWIFDSDSLTYSMSSGAGERRVTMEKGGVIYSDAQQEGSVKRASRIIEDFEQFGVCIVQTIVSSPFSAGGSGGYSLDIDANLYMSYLRDVKTHVYCFRLQLWDTGNNDETWLKYFKTTYEFIELPNEENTLFYSPSDTYNGVLLILRHNIVELKVS